MRAKNNRHTIGNFVQLLNEDRALSLQRIDDIAVMDDLVPDIDWRAITLDRQIDDLYRPINTSAKAARRGDEQPQWPTL